MLPALELRLNGPAVTTPGFRLADGSGSPRQTTTARLQATAKALTIGFRCVDVDAWGTLSGRNAPVYTEECVEIFIAPGAEDPSEYFEFELSPLGTFFDAKIHNPLGRRDSMTADLDWEAHGASWEAHIDAKTSLWTAEIRLPWPALGMANVPQLPPVWRLNLFRIDRPRDGTPAEFSCWSLTLQSPPNFHVPSRFGILRVQ
ncbi:MAG: carbohydrate-binding family 9-like protein [Verrucomicrobiales bacterium]